MRAGQAGDEALHYAPFLWFNSFVMNKEDFLHRLLELPSITHAYLSPDGRHVAYTLRSGRSGQDVFLVRTDGSQPPLALTRTPQLTRLVSWAPDGRSVVVAEDQEGDERFQLFQVFLAQPEKMQPLTGPNPPYFLRGGSLSPDGRFLYYGANYDEAIGQAIEATWVYRRDLLTGETLPLARPQRPAWVEPVLNLQGTHLVYGCKDRHPAGRQFHLIDLSVSPVDREILNFGDDVKVFARWFPDGERLAVLSEGRNGSPQPYQSLGVYSINTGRVHWLLDGAERLIESAWVSRDGSIIVNEIQDAVRRPSLVHPQTGRESSFPDVDGNLLPLGSVVGGRWVALYYAANNPEELVCFDWEPGKPVKMETLSRAGERRGIEPLPLARAEDFRWHSQDGLEVQGWLYRASPNRRRAILYIHGGPSSHAENRLYPQIQYFVARGFNVLSINYRGSTGFGVAFREKIKEDGWGGREQEDISGAAAALILAGLAESGRVGVTGTSYGGYSAWCQITRCPPELIAAAAPICGMTDLVVDYETTRPDLRSYLVEMMGGMPQQMPEKYRRRSPLYFIENIRARLLIVQGANDPNVTPQNVWAARERLEKFKIPYELLVFEDEGHGILKSANREKLYRRLADFFDSAFSET